MLSFFGMDKDMQIKIQLLVNASAQNDIALSASAERVQLLLLSFLSTSLV